MAKKVGGFAQKTAKSREKRELMYLTGNEGLGIISTLDSIRYASCLYYIGRTPRFYCIRLTACL